MLTILEDEFEIREAQQKFEAAFENLVSESIPVNVGYQGGNDDITVSWYSAINIWVYLGEVIEGTGQAKRYWNIFGTGKPEANSQISITCQINPPVNGIDRRMSGAFAKDETGDIFVVHRGRLTGRGMTKDLFQTNYQGEWVDIEDGEKENRVVLIGALNSPDFCERVHNFVVEAERIKSLVS